MRKYIMQTGLGRKPVFLPEGVCTVGFQDISEIHSRWAKLLNPETGEIHDCEAYYEEYESGLRGDAKVSQSILLSQGV